MGVIEGDTRRLESGSTGLSKSCRVHDRYMSHSLNS